MIQQLLIIAGIIGLFLFMRWVRKQPKQKKIQAISILTAIVLIGLALTGRLHWLFALFAAMVPLLQRVLSLLSYAPLIGRLFTQFRNVNTSSNPNQNSCVETEYLLMNLDHISGEMTGQVKKGAHSGKSLDNLTLAELVDLYKELAHLDTDSAQLLEAYLDRKYDDKWRDQVEEEDFSQAKATQNFSMSVEEAYNILGLDKNANDEEIIEAHRRLMQKLHPDRGGNDYLASKINQAKDILLKKAA